MGKEIAKTKFGTIRDLISSQKTQIEAAIPKHMSVEKISRIALTTFRKNTKLLNCTPESLLGAVIQCAQLGLEPNDMTGHVHLIPFKNRKTNQTDIQLIIGYQGLIELMWRTGKILSLNAHVVYENEFKAPDCFTLEYGAKTTLKHIPLRPKDRGEEKVGVYAVAELKGGGNAIEWLWKEQVEEIRDNSAGYKAAKRYGEKSIWEEHEDAMWRKTAIRAASKYLPKSTEMEEVIIAEATSGGQQWKISSKDDVADSEIINIDSEEVAEKTEANAATLTDKLNNAKQTTLDAELEADAKGKGIG